MSVLLLILIVIHSIIGWVAYFISKKAYKNLAASNNTNAKAISIVIFILGFVALSLLAFYLIVTNVRLGR